MSGLPDPAVKLAYVGVLLGDERRVARWWSVALEAAYRLSCSEPTSADAVPENGSGDDQLLVDPDEAGRRLGGVSRWTVMRYVERGELTAVTIGDRPMIRVTDLAAFVAGLPARTAKRRTAA